MIKVSFIYIFYKNLVTIKSREAINEIAFRLLYIPYTSFRDVHSSQAPYVVLLCSLLPSRKDFFPPPANLQAKGKNGKRAKKIMESSQVENRVGVQIARAAGVSIVRPADRLHNCAPELTDR